MSSLADIKAEYITTRKSYKELSRKYGMPLRTIERHGSQENWQALRKEESENLTKQIIKNEEERQCERYKKLLEVADKLLVKIETAIESIDGTAPEKVSFRSLAGALKDIRDIQDLHGEADTREQEARIARLESQNEARNDPGTVSVVLSADAEELSQ